MPCAFMRMLEICISNVSKYTSICMFWIYGWLKYIWVMVETYISHMNDLSGLKCFRTKVLKCFVTMTLFMCRNHSWLMTHSCDWQTQGTYMTDIWLTPHSFVWLIHTTHTHSALIWLIHITCWYATSVSRKLGTYNAHITCWYASHTLGTYNAAAGRHSWMSRLMHLTHISYHSCISCHWHITLIMHLTHIPLMHVTHASHSFAWLMDRGVTWLMVIR